MAGWAQRGPARELSGTEFPHSALRKCTIAARIHRLSGWPLGLDDPSGYPARGEDMGNGPARKSRPLAYIGQGRIAGRIRSWARAMRKTPKSSKTMTGDLERHGNAVRVVTAAEGNGGLFAHVVGNGKPDLVMGARTRRCWRNPIRPGNSYARKGVTTRSQTPS